MSTALYRRYRPESFDDVIGQEHVTEPLMQALRSGRVNHAYLFSGPRGCGKTTSARILARCLNCEQGPTPTPCGVCDSCVGLARGGAGTVDVIEIDAASHGGVDDARDLREKASFGPAVSRYRVYIIDEAHMVTPQGFNALLKIVEEPPEHVKFVFATTEPEKVIGTIRSRTHHYPFRLVPPARLQAYLGQLCEAEGVDVEKGVLPLVVRAGAGSVRDALSVLDQLIAGSGEGGLTYQGAVALLGYTDDALLDDVAEAFAAGDGATVFRVVDRVVESGHDPRRFVDDLLERLRDLLVISAVPDGAHTILRGRSEDQLERLRQQAGRFGAAALSRAADVVNTGRTELTGATAPRLQLELICARVLLPGAEGEQGYGARLDRIERRLSAATAEPEATVTSGAEVSGAVTSDAAPAARERGGDRVPSTVSSDAGTDSRAGAGHDRPTADPDDRAGSGGSAPVAARGMPERAAEPGGTSSAAGGAVGVEAIRRVWPDVVERLASMRRVTWMMVRDHATVHSFDGRRLTLALSNPGVLANFRSGAHGEFVQQALIDVLGVEAHIEVVPSDGPAATAPVTVPSDGGWGADQGSSAPAGPPTGSQDASEQASRPPSAAGAPSDGDAAPGGPSGAYRGEDSAAPGRQHDETRASGRSGGEPAGRRGGGRGETGPSGDLAAEPPGRQSGDPGDRGGVGSDEAPAPSAGRSHRGTASRVAPEDDEPSVDDMDAEDSGLVGRAVVERLLGGTVIDEHGI